jgi:hypothetical protein
MQLLNLTLKPGSSKTRLLATWSGDDCLRAVPPTHPSHPRAPTSLIEALASWLGTPAHAAIAVGAGAPAFCVESLFDGALLPDDTALVRFSVVPTHPPRRLPGPGDMRDLYTVHGRLS